MYGLDAGLVSRAGDGRVVHAEVGAGDQVIWLDPAAQGLPVARLGGSTSMTLVGVDDADAHHARAVQAGADVKEPIDQPYGVREYGARELEGQFCISSPPLNDKGIHRAGTPEHGGRSEVAFSEETTVCILAGRSGVRHPIMAITATVGWRTLDHNAATSWP